MKFVNGLIQKSSFFLKSTKGNTAMLFAITLAPIVMLIGGAVDYKKAINLKNKAQIAVDIAAMAYMKNYTLTANETDSANKAQALAEKELNLVSNQFQWNFQGVRQTQDGLEADVSLKTTSETAFLNVMGMQEFKVDVIARSAIYIPETSVVFVPDISWTMTWSNRMPEMVKGAKEFAKILYAAGDNLSDSLRVSLVPYADNVNISNYSSAFNDKFTSWEYRQSPKILQARKIAHYLSVQEQLGKTKVVVSTPDTFFSDYMLKREKYKFTDAGWVKLNNLLPQLWGGCIQTRQEEFDTDNMIDFAEAAPRPHTHYVTGGKKYWHCPNKNSALKVDIASSADFDLKMDKLRIGYGTSTDLGLLWAKRVLSPKWADFFNVAPRPWNSPKHPKYVVLLSDGRTSAKFAKGQEEYRGDEVIIDNMVQKTCDDLKNKGVKVVTIAYEISDDSLEHLRNCASKNLHFTALETNITTVFENIARVIKTENLRLAR